MRPPDFQFQQFAIWQDRCGMKIGADAILLGSMAPIPASSCTIIDVGAGTGIISLMLAQRIIGSFITAVEIDPAAALQAKGNIEASPFAAQISVLNTDWESFESDGQVDWVVSNPPFHKEQVVAAASRGQARYAGYLLPEKLLEKAIETLKPDGQISLIGPPDYIRSCAAWLLPLGWNMTHLVKIYPKPNRPVSRWLASWSKMGRPLQAENLTIRKADGEYSAAYREVTSHFYLSL